jgi:hypothetical protein
MTDRANWIKQQLSVAASFHPLAESEKPVRLIVTPPRGKDGLTIQPKEVGPDREQDEAHHREIFANHFKYADLYTGNTRTYDEQGDYNCGRCNQFNAGSCLLLKRKSVDPAAGSCGDWEDTFAGDPELVLNEKTDEAAGYGVAANGKGFGCHRCPYASKAIEPDSQGRNLYCGKGDFRVFNNACCVLNGAPLAK